MALCLTFCKGKPLLDDMERAKLNVERTRLGLEPVSTWQEELGQKMQARKLRCRRKCCPCCFCDFYTKRCNKCCKVGGIPRKLGACIGFFSIGALLTILWYFLMTYQMQTIGLGGSYRQWVVRNSPLHGYGPVSRRTMHGKHIKPFVPFDLNNFSFTRC